MSDPTPPQPPYESPPHRPPSYPPLPLAYAVPTTSPRPTSVLVLSILGIAIGSYRVLCAPVSFFAVFAVSRGTLVTRTAAGTTMATTTAATAMPSLPPALMWSTLAFAVISLILGVMLLIGGIGSLMLKPWARLLMLWYAAVSLVIALGRSAMSLYEMPMTRQRTSGRGDLLLFIIVGSFVFSVLMGIAYPLFVLVFLRRRDVVEAFETHRSR